MFTKQGLPVPAMLIVMFIVMLIWVLLILASNMNMQVRQPWQSRFCSAPLLRRHEEALKQQGWRGVWLQPLQGQGAPDSHGASAVPPHPASACPAADPFAVDPLVVDQLDADDLLAAEPLAEDPLAAGPAAEDPPAVEALAADPHAPCAAAAVAAAAGVEAVAAAAVAAAAAVVAVEVEQVGIEQVGVEQVEVEQVEVEHTEQLQLALALTLTASLAWLACHLFLSDLAFQACPAAFLSFAAAPLSPAAAFPGPHADGFAAVPVAWAPCLPTSFCATSAAGPCQLGQSLFCQQY